MRAAVQHHAADELDVEVPHVEHAAAGFADDGERFGQQVVERLALATRAAELGGLARAAAASESGVDAALEFADCRDERTQTFELALVLRADDFGEDGVENHGKGLSARSGRHDYPAIVADWPTRPTRRRGVGAGAVRRQRPPARAAAGRATRAGRRGA